jgi:hypothetical protein
VTHSTHFANIAKLAPRYGCLVPPYILHKKETNLLQFCQISSSPGNSLRNMMSGKVRFHIEKITKLVL